MRNLFWRIRIKVKWLWKQHFQIQSYCKVCGRRVTDFHASNYLWDKVVGDWGKIWCFDCFTTKCRSLKICTVLDVIPHDDSEFVGEGECRNHRILSKKA